MTKATRWAWIISLVAITGAVLVLSFLLSIATNNRELYERHYAWLFWVNVTVAAFLVLVIGAAAVRLLLRVQRGKFGSRMLLKLAAPLLIGDGLPPGAQVLDACAAPGGKTAHLLELADVDLLAIDSDPARLQRVADTLRRLSLQARTAAADAATPAAWWDGRPFDAILLDAPCTASGIVRRHPDVRWLRRPGDIPALAKTQARLLEALWPTLKPGGRLLYCTCSVFKAEGQDQIDAFLQRRSDASLAKHPPSPGHLLPLPDNGDEARSPAIGASPDGFYYALLKKT